jgi:hypothetical protein
MRAKKEALLTEPASLGIRIPTADEIDAAIKLNREMHESGGCPVECDLLVPELVASGETSKLLETMDKIASAKLSTGNIERVIRGVSGSSFKGGLVAGLLIAKGWALRSGLTIKSTEVEHGTGEVGDHAASG